MGFYASIFFKSWLVVAQNVRGADTYSDKFSMILDAPTREDAVNKMREYLTQEQFSFGTIHAHLG
jgi:hypothetical protein